MTSEEHKSSGMKAFMMPVRISQAGTDPAVGQKVVQPKMEVSAGQIVVSHAGQIAGTHRVIASHGTDPNSQNTIIIIPAQSGEHGDGQSVTYQILPQSSPMKTTAATPGKVQVQIHQQQQTQQQLQQPKPAVKSPHPALAQVRRVIQGNLGTPGGADMAALMKVQKEPTRAPDLDPSLTITVDPKKQSKDQRTLTLPPVSMDSLVTTNLCIEIEVDDALSVGELDSCKLKNGKTKYFFKISKMKIPMKAERFGLTPRSNPRVTIVGSKRKNNIDDIDYEDEEFEEMELEQTPAIVRKTLKKMKLDTAGSEGEEDENESGEEEKEEEEGEESEQENVKPAKATEMKDDGTFDENDENFDASVGDDDDDFEEEVNEAEEESEEEEEDDEEEETGNKKGSAKKGKKSARKTAKKSAPKKRAAAIKRIVKEKPLIEEVTYSPEVKSLTKAVPKGLLDEEGTPKRSYFRTNAYAKNDKFVVIREGAAKGGKPLLVCKECGFQTPYQTSMSGHLNGHANLNPFVCGLCGTGFRDQSNLNMHLRSVHADSRDFVCDVCCKMFKTQRTLTVHYQRHFASRKYVCDTCGKVFNHIASMSIHKRQHKDTKEYQCSHCEKSFYTRSDLSRHEFIHTREGKHQCHICEKKFFRLGYWRDHMRVKHNITDVENMPHHVLDEPSNETQISSRLETHVLVDQTNDGLEIQTNSGLETTSRLVVQTSDGIEANSRLLVQNNDGMEAQSGLVGQNNDGLEAQTTSGIVTSSELVDQMIVDLETSSGLLYKTSNELATNSGLVFLTTDGLETNSEMHASNELETHSGLVFVTSDGLETNSEMKLQASNELETNAGLVDQTRIGLEPQIMFTGRETSQAMTIIEITDTSEMTEAVKPSGDDQEFICDVSSQTFKSEGRIAAHYKQNFHGDQAYVCNTCEKSFSNRKSLYSHRLTHKEKAYKCGQCEKSFYLKSDLTRHEFVHTRVGQHKCDLCESSFNRLEKLRAHMALHDVPEDETELGTTPEVEVKPDDEPGTTSNLTKRKSAVREKRPGADQEWICDVCTKKFKSKLRLSEHYKRHFPCDKSYVCDTCGKNFSWRNSLYLHRLTHKERPYKCGQCERSFYLKSDLTRHEFTHTRVGQHMCHICGTSFARLKKWRDHMAWHENLNVIKQKPEDGPGTSSDLRTCEVAAKEVSIAEEKNCVCDICNLAFNTKRRLTNHYKSHFPVNRPYVCDTCGKAFKRISSINEHKKRHREAQYKCAHCTKSFHLKSDLARHEFIHTRVSQHQCELCQKSFCRIDHLREHVKKHHSSPFSETTKNQPARRKKKEVTGVSRRETSEATSMIVMVNQEEEKQQAPDDLDLPDDLNLDNDEDQEGKDEEFAVDDGSVITGKDEEETQPPPAEEPEDNVEHEMREETAGDQEQKYDEDRPEGEEVDNPTDEQTDTDPNRNEEEGKEEQGFTPQDKPTIADENQDADEQEETEDTNQAVEHYGKTSHDSSDNVEQSETAQDAAGGKSETDNQEVAITEKNCVCNICNLTFNTKQSLGNHYREHFPYNMPYVCDICGKVFRRVSSFNEHKKRHREAQHKCAHCAKSFHLKSDLARHEFIHTRVSKHQCELCKKSFCRIDHLREHIMNHHSDPNTATKKNQPAHGKKKEVSIAEEKNWVCDICNLAFNTKRSRGHHYREHYPDNMPYMCDTCGKVFKGVSSINEHKKRHREAQHKCAHCAKSFHLKSDLTRHEFIHTRVSQHQCEHCEKSFCRIDHLLEHIKKRHSDPNTAAKKNKPVRRKKKEVTGVSRPEASEATSMIVMVNQEEVIEEEVFDLLAF
ncbi:uncharacterized protein LOC127861072 isoform X2 [Dreissena polymorpha]|uniref:uncharacterized protein LOC127861072 isoform X2 n=1 Tax=Dreissena polymorpha TaxID=45954 RepID=UPI00226519AA|nr:uncharacterized protein LOC127861072 isoform X2 [Dreissena polymorpha]